MRTPNALVALALAVAPLATAVLAAAPAHAVDEIQLSSDGRTWANNIVAPLFDPAVRWVPGDVRTARFFARSTRLDRGDLRIDVFRARVDALVDTGSLDVSARVGNRPWTSISAGGAQQLADEDDFRGGATVPVLVRVELDGRAPNGTMVLAADLDFRVRLVDSDARTDARTDDQDDRSRDAGVDDGAGSGVDSGADRSEAPGVVADVLPDTGNLASAWLPPLSVLLIGTGAYLITRRRSDPTCPPLVPSAVLEESHHV